MGLQLLLVTNLYPPQELGGYGRSMADFRWALERLGHTITVVSSDAAYLGPIRQPELRVHRGLQLKGSFENGVKLISDPIICAGIEQHNSQLLENILKQAAWDGVLLGNIDLLGLGSVQPLLNQGIPVLHHVGFIGAPFPPGDMPKQSSYKLVAASQAVRQSLLAGGLPIAENHVVYPGARVDLFGAAATGGIRQMAACGTPAKPLKVCFAGLMMTSKGAHTVAEALVLLKQQGISVHANFAGDNFQAGYREFLEQELAAAGLDGVVQFVGKLTRKQLARFFLLHQVCVFPSIHPEAFGIVGAEAMASGLALVTSGVGGAAELIENGVSGLRFNPGDARSLAHCLEKLLNKPSLLEQLRKTGEQNSRQLFSVETSAKQLESLFISNQKINRDFPPGPRAGAAPPFDPRPTRFGGRQHQAYF